MLPENDPLRRAVAKVVAGYEYEKRTGTAFLVADKYALTALHIVADRQKSDGEDNPIFYEPIKLNFIDAKQERYAKPVKGCWHILQDWVLLELCDLASEDTKFDDLTPLPLENVRALWLGKLKDNEKPEWDSFGYAALAKDDGIGADGYVAMQAGKWEGVHVYQLQCVQAAAGQGEKLEGLSGSPCLVRNTVIGIIRASNVDEIFKQGVRGYVQRGGIVYACPIISLLERKQYLPPEVLEVIERVIGHSNVDFTAAIEILQENPVARAALYSQISQNTNISDAPDKIVSYLASITIPELIEKVLEAQKQTSDQIAHKDLTNLLLAMLPSLYDSVWASRIHSSKSDPTIEILEIPYATDISAEMLMASADNRSANFRLVSIDIDNPDRKQAIPDRYKLALPPESGLASNQTIENISDDLFRRLMAKDSIDNIAIAIDEHLFKKISPKQANRSYKPNDKKKLIRSALDRDVQLQKPSYYWIWNSDEDHQDSFSQLAREIKADYPAITLLSLNNDIDREIEENNLFASLPDTLNT